MLLFFYRETSVDSLWRWYEHIKLYEVARDM
jgi:hypothetical protein